MVKITSFEALKPINEVGKLIVFSFPTTITTELNALNRWFNRFVAATNGHDYDRAPE